MISKSLYRTIKTVSSILAFFAASCNTPTSVKHSYDASDTPGTTLPAGMYELIGYPPKIEQASLTAVGDLCAGATVVALGEQHHTSDGFYQVKVQVIKYLVEHRGYRALAFEDNWSSVLGANEFLHGRSDSAKAAILDFFLVWQAQPILELLIWLRAFNDAHPMDPVSIFGFDVQDHENNSVKYLMSFLDAQQNRQPAQSLKKELASCINKSRLVNPSCMEVLTRVDALRRENGTWQFVPIAIETLRSFGIHKIAPDQEDRMLAHRDRAMATIFFMMKEIMAKDKKTIVWAANGHIIKKNMGPSPQNSMGHFLAEVFKKKYVSIGLIASEYSTLPFLHDVGPGQKHASPGSLEEWLETYTRESLFVNFHQLSQKTLGWSEAEFKALDLTTFYDGIIYLRSSPATTLIK